MILTIFGATGMVGKRIVSQALAQGNTVKAFGRNVENLIDRDLDNDKLLAIKGYIFEEEDVLQAIKGSDVVISVLGGAFNGQDQTRSLGIKTIIGQMNKIGLKRIVALGGLGILNADEETLLIDTPEYPEEYKPVGREHLKAFEYLKESNLNWTFVCAPDIKDEEGQGNYHTNKDYPPIPNNGQIKAGDLADFMIKEAKENNFLKSRVGISN